MRCCHLVLASVFLACSTGIAFAQQQSAAPPPLTLPRQQETSPTSTSPIETVVVTANANGPAIWHATKDGADVAIMGIVQPLPDGFSWNTKPLDSLLAQTRLVLLPPDVRMGVFSGTWFYLTEGDLLHPPEGRTLWQILDANVAADLARACQLLREPETRYSDNSPVLAAMRLGSDFRHVFYLTTHEPEDSIAALARARGVHVRRIATYDLVASAEELLKLPATVTGQCIEAQIRDMNFQSRHVAAAANAWALADVKGMMANWSPSNYYECLVQLSPHATGIDARSIEDTVQAIDAALANGGRTLAVVNIGILMRNGGVLDRLKESGVTVTGP